MKNVLLVLVGGTICTTLTQYGTLSVGSNAGVRLVQGFKESDSPYKDSVNITTSENLGILSENMTVDKWNLIIKAYKQAISEREYDGVIFAHGTDTLAYSASLFSMLLANTKIPVFFASSNARLGTPAANGDDNFRCAVECICRGIEPDIYVAYKNISDGRMYLHLGSRLEQCKNYSDDFFSVGAIDITNFNEADFEALNGMLREKYSVSNEKSFIDTDAQIILKDCVLLLNPYVGVNYTAYNYSSFSAVLHGSYHCGTACVEKTEEEESYSNHSILYMLDKCAECGTDTYITPTRQAGEFYDTIRIMANHGERNMNYLYGTTQETAYAKLLIAYSVFKDKNKIKEFLESEINNEIIYK